MKTFFLVQMFYSPIGYLASIMFLMPCQYFYLVSRYLNLIPTRVYGTCLSSLTCLLPNEKSKKKIPRMQLTMFPAETRLEFSEYF